MSWSLARLAAVRFAEPCPRVFFAELFFAFDFFIEPSVRIARPNDASIVGAMGPVKSKWQIGRQSRPPARSAGSRQLVFARLTSSACCPGINFSRLPQNVARSQPPSELAPRPYRSTSLVAEENQVCAASHTEFAEQIGDMEYHGALGDVQPVRDLTPRLAESSVQANTGRTTKNSSQGERIWKNNSPP